MSAMSFYDKNSILREAPIEYVNKKLLGKTHRFRAKKHLIKVFSLTEIFYEMPSSGANSQITLVSATIFLQKNSSSRF